MAILDYP